MRYLRALEDSDVASRTFGLMHEAAFAFRTLHSARDIATVLANAFPDPKRVVIGLTELLVNAVEHGNLAITYDEKSRLREEGGEATLESVLAVIRGDVKQILTEAKPRIKPLSWNEDEGGGKKKKKKKGAQPQPEPEATAASGPRVIFVVGVNGTGKTTLLRIVLGQVEPDAGTARLLASRVRLAVTGS